MQKKEKIYEISSGLRFKPDIFHPVYKPGQNRTIRISEKKKKSGSTRVNPDTDRSTIGAG